MNRFFLLFFLLALPFWVPSAYRRTTHAFRPAKCFIEWPFVPEWDTSPLQDAEILTVLERPFTYLSKGAQSYVFLSEDGKYVLKLFRYDTCRFPFGRLTAEKLRRFANLKPRHYVPAEEKIPFTFDSCMLAYQFARKQTGLVYLHLNPKEGLPLLHLVDKWKRTHTIDPSRYRFALQKKAEPFDCSNLESLRELLHELSAAGLFNTDPKLKRNFGCLDGRAVVIDFGNFIYHPEKAKEQVAIFENKLHKTMAKQ